MTVYLDVIFFINLLYQYGILKVLTVLCKIRATNLRLVSGAALGSLLYCICVVMQIPLDSFMGKVTAGIVIGVVVNLVAFMPITMNKVATLVLMQCTLSFCLSGLLQLLPMDGRTGYLMLSASGAVIFLCLFTVKVKKIIFEKLRQDQSIYRIRIYHGGKHLEANALVDTGNHLTDPFSGEVVIVMQKSTAGKLLEEDAIRQQPGYRIIPYESIGKTDGILEAFRLERLEVLSEAKMDEKDKGIFTNIICAVHDQDYSNDVYEVILHPLMF